MGVINSDLILFLTVLSLLAGLLSVVLIFFTIRSGKKLNYAAIALFTVLSIYSFGYALELQCFPINTTLRIISVEYIGISLAPVLLFLLIIRYWGFPADAISPYIPLLFIIPVITLLIGFSNQAIPWLYSKAWMSNSPILPGFEMVPGIWWYVVIAWNAILLTVCCIILLFILFTKGDLYWKQAFLMLIGILAPFSTLFLNSIVRKVIPIDITPFALVITGFTMFMAIFRYNVFNIVPIAYASVFKRLGSGLIVLDSQGRVREINPAFEEIFQVKGSEMIGRDINSSLPDGFFLADLAKCRTITRKELKISGSEKTEYFLVDVIPFDENDISSAGSVLMITRVTDQKEKERLLLEYTDIIENRTTELIAAYDEKGAAYDLLNKKQQALEESERSLRRAEALAHLGIYEWNIPDNRVSASDEFKKILGIRDGESLPVYEDLIRYILPSDRNNVIASVQTLLKSGTPFTTNFSIIRDDNIIRKIRALGEIENDDNGVFRQFILIIQDITEEKRMEEEISEAYQEKKILLSEIHHRVKNNLQVISSLLSMQARTIKDPETRSLFKETQTRIKSIALVHEHIYQSSNLNKIKYRDYVQNITVYIFNLYEVLRDRVKCRIEIENIEISVDKAVPLSLIISELVTNSLKYAFNETNLGEIIISLTQDPDKRGYILDYKDNGTGFPAGFDPKMSQGFGSTLIMGLTRQLSGNISIDSGESGIHYIIYFPV